MKKFFVLGAAVLLSLGLVLTGCPNDNKPTNNPTGANPFVSGTFSGKKFVAYKAADINKSVRTISDSDTVALTGYVQDGSTVYELEGFYDEESGNFILSGAYDDAGFTINGYALDEYQGAVASSWETDDSTDSGYAMSLDSVTIDEDVTFDEDEAMSSTAQKIPAKFHGKWDYSSMDNSLAVEQFYSSWGDPGDFCMVIADYSIALWVDLAAFNEYVDDYLETTNMTDAEKAEYKTEQMAVFEGMMKTYQVLDVNTHDNFTDVIIMFFRGDTDFPPIFRVLRLAETTDGIKATVGTCLATDPLFERYKDPEDPYFGEDSFPPRGSSCVSPYFTGAWNEFIRYDDPRLISDPEDPNYDEDLYDPTAVENWPVLFGAVWETEGGMNPAQDYLINFVDDPRPLLDPDDDDYVPEAEAGNIASLYMKKFE